MIENLLQKVEHNAAAFLNLLHPRRCLACKSDLSPWGKKHLCPQCWESIVPIPHPFCALCGIFLPDGGMHCYSCGKEKKSFEYLRSSANFEGTVKDLIHHFKYGGKDYLAGELSSLLMRTWMENREIRESEIIVAVPLHSRNLRERGYNQSALLAKELRLRIKEKVTEDLAPQFLENVLLRVRDTVSQTELTKEERNKNVESAFGVNNPDSVTGKDILLIDDVCTTCSTLNACARTLRDAGASKVYGLTLARD